MAVTKTNAVNEAIEVKVNSETKTQKTSASTLTGKLQITVPAKHVIEGLRGRGKGQLPHKHLSEINGGLRIRAQRSHGKGESLGNGMCLTKNHAQFDQQDPRASRSCLGQPEVSAFQWGRNVTSTQAPSTMKNQPDRNCMPFCTATYRIFMLHLNRLKQQKLESSEGLWGRVQGGE